MAGRPVPPDNVYFPVVPMLDMAFQLLAFFILTFQGPSLETRIDLDLPSAPAALPRDGTPSGAGSESDLILRAEADESGALRSLRLGTMVMRGLDDLTEQLREWSLSEPVRVAFVADDRLSYDEAARLLGACASAGVTTIRLVPAPSGGAP